jgi:hypothetical protein
VRALGLKIERLAAHAQDGLSDQDRAHIEAWEARLAERYRGGSAPSPEQLALLEKAGFWQQLQRTWARPAFARACLEAIERRRVKAG